MPLHTFLFEVTDLKMQAYRQIFFPGSLCLLYQLEGTATLEIYSQRNVKGKIEKCELFFFSRVSISNVK